MLRASAANCPNRDAAEHSFPTKSMSLREGKKVFLLLLFKSVLNIRKYMVLNMTCLNTDALRVEMNTHHAVFQACETAHVDKLMVKGFLQFSKIIFYKPLFSLAWLLCIEPVQPPCRCSWLCRGAGERNTLVVLIQSWAEPGLQHPGHPEPSSGHSLTSVGQQQLMQLPLPTQLGQGHYQVWVLRNS